MIIFYSKTYKSANLRCTASITALPNKGKFLDFYTRSTLVEKNFFDNKNHISFCWVFKKTLHMNYSFSSNNTMLPLLDR